MIVRHNLLSEINGSLVTVDGAPEASFDEIAYFHLDNGSIRTGRVVKIEGKKATVQVFDGTRGMSLSNSSVVFGKRPIELTLSPDILGRTFDGLGRPKDGLGEVYGKKVRDVNGAPINPVARNYPKNFIQTGISTIDALATLVRGQKLPIFSGYGMKHNELAAQIVKQAKVADNSEFAIVFAAMGVKNDVAQYFKSQFEKSNVMNKVVMFLNLSNDPIIERIITPKCALTAAEYLAFDLGMNILVILTDMTAYAEALREFSSSKGDIPGRKGFPGYLYSDLASIYERAGLIEGREGSVTQIPILTMPNDDITHPIPDLTGYITEGQIVLDRGIDGKGIYPPVNVLPSLSRLMKDCIRADLTRKDHASLSNQIMASYSKVQDARSLASVIGEDELSEDDKLLMKFGDEFERRFVNQDFDEDRSIEQTLNLGWELLSILPRRMLDRVDDKILDEYYGKVLNTSKDQ